ncbi:glycosyltransferase family 2 protein [Nafulsella turpanensis]|uniref:glycosyltransferase family 2 protein n=1 Tax=Nafulsella turpanensis TaxID=1265690 RepID=UPI000345EE4C|nr:glycosyltransferase family 2 protein [Nafulsella turpanensis]
MKISVVTVVYNNINTIRETIESVLGQDYPDLEYIIVDGASTDGTLELVKGYGSRISRFISEPDKGLYDAINKGIKLASGDVVGLLHSDDLFYHSGVVSKIAKAFQQNAVDSVYADLHYVAQHDTLRVVRDWRSGEYKRNRFQRGWMPPHPTFYVKKVFYERFGLYDTEFKSAADYELMLRLLYKHGISTHYIPDTLVKMRVGGESNRSLKNRLRANKEDFMAWKKNNLHPKFYTRFLKPLRKLPQFLSFRRRSYS